MPLRGQTKLCPCKDFLAKIFLRGPSWKKRGVLRGPPRPPRIKRVQGVLRAPSRTDQIMPLQRFSSWSFVEKKRCSPRPSASSADKKGSRCSPCPFADRPNYALAKIFFVALRGPSWKKRGVLRGPPRPPRIKRVQGVLRAPSRTDQNMPLQRFSSWSFVALRGKKEVFSAALRVLRG